MNMERKKFIVLGHLTTNEALSFDNETLTEHYNYERKARHNKIMDNIGNGHCIATFRVDKGHPNGDELHNILSNGIILIQNERTKKVITELIARPQQIKRYWIDFKENFPTEYEDILDLASEHQKKGWNEW